MLLTGQHPPFLKICTRLDLSWLEAFSGNGRRPPGKEQNHGQIEILPIRRRKKKEARAACLFFHLL